MTRKGSKLNADSLWLLRFIVARLPGGYAVTTPMPSDRPPGVSMLSMRGLQRRGLVRESESGGIFYATQEGAEVLKEYDDD
jgi:hypothetical protein